MTNRNHCESFVLRHYFVIRHSCFVIAVPHSGPVQTARRPYHAIHKELSSRASEDGEGPHFRSSRHPNEARTHHSVPDSLTPLGQSRRGFPAPNAFGASKPLLLYVPRTRGWRLCFSNTDIS